MRGWVLDCYPDLDANRMVIWFKTPGGAVRVVDDMTPYIYVCSSRERLRKLAGDLAMIGVRGAVSEMRRTSLGDKEREVLAIPVREYASLQSLATTIDSWGGYREYALYNVDLRMDQRYFLFKGLFAMGLTKIDGLKNMDAWKASTTRAGAEGIGARHQGEGGWSTDHGRPFDVGLGERRGAGRSRGFRP